MKLIFLYGPPAVGKLTIAKELAKLTNYKIFHNHSAIDLASEIFKFGSKPYKNLRRKIQIEVFKSAAKENMDLIFTYCYDKPKSNNFVKKIIQNIEKYKGKIYFVQLICSKEELHKRVKEASRKKYRKIKSVKVLDQKMKEWDLFSKIPFVKSLTIDNTKISAKKVAEKIKEYYKL